VTKPLQENLWEMLNRPVRWRTVLVLAWFAYCIWGVTPEWGIWAGTILATGPIVALQYYIEGERLRYAIAMGVALALAMPPIIVAVSYPLETLQFLLGFAAWIVGALN
jgi:hypothetical protein